MKVYGVAVGVAAVAAAGQLWLALWARVLAPDEAFHPAFATWGNDVWPVQLVVLVWCVASAAVLGAVAAGGKPLVAALGALAPSFVVIAWMPADTATTTAVALVLGAVIGGAAGFAVAAWRGMGRCAVVWLGWVWLNVALGVVVYDRPRRDAHVPVDPLGMFTWTSNYTTGYDSWVLVPALLVATALSWWAGHRGDRRPILGAVAGPLLLVAVYVAVWPLLTGGADGSPDRLGGGLVAWLSVAVMGAAAAALIGTIQARRGSPAAV
ncbi:hypothetical protein K1W54_25105 [Micromonospora sp. CPCC 205371]|nr:hypothetical protein [Micromonospora sp. CPCC 205371]